MMTYKMPDSCQIRNLAELYEKYFPNYDGVFVDVGAHDGYTFSNTYGLAEVGWRGVCYEPMPELNDKCMKLHFKQQHKVLTIHSCVGDRVGEVRLYVGSNPTIDEETVRLSPWDDTYDEHEFIMSYVTTLNVSLTQLTIPEKFEVLSIDVEGAELQVLAGFDIMKWLPRMVIVETHENHPDKRKSFHSGAINAYFADKPYVKIQVDGLNTIWIHEDLNTVQPSS
jgi:FkbM family methyltransferase